MGFIGKERRRYPRIKAGVTISYKLLEEAKGKKELALTKDVSSGGFLLSTDKKLKSSDSLILDIKLPGQKQSVQIMAKVLDSKPAANGVIYDTRVSVLVVDQKHKDFISDLLKDCSSGK